MNKILVLNAGSSSHKSCLYEIGSLSGQLRAEPPSPLWQAEIDWQQHPPVVKAVGANALVEIQLNEASSPPPGRRDAIATLLSTLHQGDTAVLSGLLEIEAIGHRVVHGGQQYQQSVWIDNRVKEAIACLIPLAPAHNPVNLEGINLIEQLLGDVPQFAVFDTAFHSQMPEAAALYPVPQHWIDLGIRRYGFHGISHQYCARRIAQLLVRPLSSLRLVICHLGNGCSLSAVQGGHSVDTTMGFTPVDGLMMGMRSGSLDPGILTYLIREKGFSYQQIDREINQESGLKGISNLSSDMREIEAAMVNGHPTAKLAFDMYIHRLTAAIAAMTASLGGLDALVFTAGIGENSSLVRAEACKRLGFLGIALSEKCNNEKELERDKVQSKTDRPISTRDSLLPVWVIHTRENWQIAQEYQQLCSSMT